jgi:hypothetical protein
VRAERWQQLKVLFAEALEQPPAERRGWLARACAGDNELGNQAEALLDAYDEDPGFLETSAPIDPSDLQAVLDPPASAALPPGTILGDRQYQIVGELGRGGMGIVYVAQDLRLPRRVALKSLPDHARRDPVRLERLRREAWAVARVSHPAVATVYAFEDLGGQPFIVSEYVRGRTLRSELERGPLDPARAAAIAIDIARALGAAHDQGVVHRDLKPENVILVDGGGVKVVDFGIAQLARDDAPGLTLDGIVIGTPAYMAPEQTEGGPVDGRADIFSLGVVLGEMLTGRHPLRGGTPVAGASVLALDAIPGRLGAVVRRCLHLLPSERYGATRELLRDLERAAAQEPIGQEPGSATWWWQFHQLATVAVYVVLVAVAWQSRYEMATIDARADGAFVVALLVSSTVSAGLRLNLWFTSRILPGELRRLRRQRKGWILAADLGLAATLVAAGVLMLIEQGERLPPVALVASGIGVAMACLLVEPVTARAAFDEMEA